MGIAPMRRAIGQFACVIAMAAGFCVVASAPAPADIYVLANDGQVRGELQNIDEAPRQKYVILTPDGATVTLDRAAVKQIIPQLPAEVEFEKIRPTYADTADDQWRLAEWCRENSLSPQRQVVLEHIIELDPEYRPARLALGYQMVDGRWLQKQQIMQQKGYVRYKGEWRLPQEVELIERYQKEDAAQRQWYATLKRWRMWLDESSRAEQAHASILAIRDPHAVPALQQMFSSERDRDVRMLYVQALAAIATPAALRTLIDHSLDDGDEEIRLACLDRIVAHPQPEVVAAYVAALKSQSNARLNRAAHALGRLGDKSAIGPLIDSLVTTHIVQEGDDNPNRMNAAFSPQGGMAFSTGSSVRKEKRTFNNQPVLDALVALSGVNLNFDEKAWKTWYASQKTKAPIDVRRD
jgi:HEAT repeats